MPVPVIVSVLAGWAVSAVMERILRKRDHGRKDRRSWLRRWGPLLLAAAGIGAGAWVFRARMLAPLIALWRRKKTAAAFRVLQGMVPALAVSRMPGFIRAVADAIRMPMGTVVERLGLPLDPRGF